MYLRNSQARRLLPIPAGPDDADQPGAALAPGGVEQVLEQAQLVVAADERRLERLASGRARRRSATTRSARHAGTGALLPLSACSPAASKAMRPRRRAASPRRPGRCPAPRRTGAGGGVDEVAGDHALVRRAERDRRLAGQDAGPRLDAAARGVGPASTRSSAARTARSASSSWAIGAPHTAMTASPMNFSTVPP